MILVTQIEDGQWENDRMSDFTISFQRQEGERNKRERGKKEERKWKGIREKKERNKRE